MVISLQKGQRIDLTKGNASLNQIMVGLGWDPVGKSSGGGLLGGLFGGNKNANIDCDASVIMLQNDKFVNKNDLIYFGNLKSSCTSVRHSGDNLTGDGDGDDEQIMINLKSIPERYNKLVFVVNIYDAVNRKQDFGMIQNAYIRVVNDSSKQELVKFNLTDNYGDLTTLVTGEIYRHNGEWKFAAIGDGTRDRNLSEVVSKFQ
ncbi:TerD family protein [Bacillus massiliigorillae]|uniref:TerD family protein n=1 Tax=Bacillus massiliigorillae TaxID=1243664 RepID=UPI0003A3DF92|nr:TerD family protein [Bacillus massiliigorillae]